MKKQTLVDPSQFKIEDGLGLDPQVLFNHIVMMADNDLEEDIPRSKRTKFINQVFDIGFNTCTTLNEVEHFMDGYLMKF